MPDFSKIRDSFFRKGLSALAQSRLPKINGKVELAGLHATVEIFRDQRGVPHIYADHIEDLFFAQGYVHAQDRLWQMEFDRRLVAGRLSEILGAQSVPLDRWIRTLTMRRVAEAEVGLLNDRTQKYLQAYADGVNALIAQKKLPIEFLLLRYKPEPWCIADTLAWIKMMAWSLSVNWEMEILRALLISRLGSEMAAQLEVPHLERWPYIIPPGTDYGNIGDIAIKNAQAARPFTGPSPYQGVGSNNWVIAGEHTNTTMPLLANDMHLLISIPSIWYENHLICDDLNVTGVIFPGIPGIISGHNGHVAWGYTNGFPDVQDLYMERLRRTQDGRVQAEYNGQWEDVTVLKELIRVKGADPVMEEVIVTRHGPIINSLAPDVAGEQPMALRWTALEPDTMIQGLFDMMLAHDCQEFHQALRQWATPVQNVVYADTAGNIAYTYPGKIPIRASGDGRTPVPGWTDKYEWIGYLPFESLPHLYNPPQGYVATANNRTISNDYPVNIVIEPISGDRAQRIVEMIRDSDVRNGKPIDIAYIQRMHFDQLSPSARIVAQYLGKLPQESESPAIRAIIERMASWDGTLSPNSMEAAVYQAFIRQMARLMLTPKLDPPEEASQTEQGNNAKKLTIRYMGKGPTPVLAEGSVFGALWLPWLIQTLSIPDSHWFEIGEGASRDEVMILALQKTVEELKELLGPDIEGWNWGKLHSLTYRHVLAVNKTLANFFNRGPLPVGGDQTTICALGSNSHDLGCEQLVGPPYRMIVDLGDLRNSLSMLTPGQSGNPASPYYDDQAHAWLTARYYTILYERTDIEKQSPNRLMLTPE